MTVTVQAVDPNWLGANGQPTPIPGTVLINGVTVGVTNAQFQYTFAYQFSRVFDTELRRYITVRLPPEGTVTASGYTERSIPFNFSS
jgi:hypothetical protein